MRSFEEGELPRLDARLRRVGEWLLLGYTIAMVLVTFVVPEQPERASDPSSDAMVKVFVG